MLNEVDHSKGRLRKWVTNPRAMVDMRTVSAIDRLARERAVTETQVAALGSRASREEVIINENALGGTFFPGIRSVREWVWNGRVRRHEGRQRANTPK